MYSYASRRTPPIKCHRMRKWRSYQFHAITESDTSVSMDPPPLQIGQSFQNISNPTIEWTFPHLHPWFGQGTKVYIFYDLSSWNNKGWQGIGALHNLFFDWTDSKRIRNSRYRLATYWCILAMGKPYFRRLNGGGEPMGEDPRSVWVIRVDG